MCVGGPTVPARLIVTPRWVAGISASSHAFPSWPQTIWWPSMVVMMAKVTLSIGNHLLLEYTMLPWQCLTYKAGVSEHHAACETQARPGLKSPYHRPDTFREDLGSFFYSGMRDPAIYRHSKRGE